MGIRTITADVFEGLAQLPDESVSCVVTSPPYWGLRDYGTGQWEGGDPECDHRSPTMRDGRNEDRSKLAGSEATNSYQLRLAHHAECGKCGARKIDSQIGLEPTLAEHIAVLVRVFREVKRVLRKDGTLWLNYGDAYNAGTSAKCGAGNPAIGGWNGSETDGGARINCASLKPKDLMMMPARLAIALQDDGWFLRSKIILHKLNPMPESVTDRPTCAYEELFLLAKQPRYFYDADAVREPHGPDSVARVGRGRSDNHKWAEAVSATRRLPQISHGRAIPTAATCGTSGPTRLNPSGRAISPPWRHRLRSAASRLVVRPAA